MGDSPSREFCHGIIQFWYRTYTKEAIWRLDISIWKSTCSWLYDAVPLYITMLVLCVHEHILIFMHAYCVAYCIYNYSGNRTALCIIRVIIIIAKYLLKSIIVWCKHMMQYFITCHVYKIDCLFFQFMWLFLYWIALAEFWQVAIVNSGSKHAYKMKWSMSVTRNMQKCLVFIHCCYDKYKRV